MTNVLEVLKERGLLEDVTSPAAFELVRSPTCVYAGFDPTSDSLQAGNLVAIIMLAHFQRCGHKVVVLVGGATGMIGDPSGKSQERNLLTEEEIGRNVVGIRENLSRFMDFDRSDKPAVMVNNSDWLGSFTYIGFLRDVGKHFRMGTMLGKESVRRRLETEVGMSYAEFSYQLLQAYDFLRLHETQGCMIQVGGSDQWGNITAGIDLVRKLKGSEVFGATTALVCDSSGAKFGKSAGNAIYLDRRKTSCYDFYQFFVRTEDADVIRYLKTFTFVPMPAIAELDEQVRKAPEQRAAQKVLADEVTRLVHGEEGLSVAKRASNVMFGESMEGLNADDLMGVFANVPSAELPRSAVESAKCVDLAVAAGVSTSKSEARRLIEKGGLYVNNRRVAGVDAILTRDDIVDGRLVVLRSGKKSYFMVKVK